MIQAERQIAQSGGDPRPHRRRRGSAPNSAPAAAILHLKIDGQRGDVRVAPAHAIEASCVGERDFGSVFEVLGHRRLLVSRRFGEVRETAAGQKVHRRHFRAGLGAAGVTAAGRGRHGGVEPLGHGLELRAAHGGDVGRRRRERGGEVVPEARAGIAGRHFLDQILSKFDNFGVFEKLATRSIQIWRN